MVVKDSETPLFISVSSFSGQAKERGIENNRNLGGTGLPGLMIESVCDDFSVFRPLLGDKG